MLVKHFTFVVLCALLSSSAAIFGQQSRLIPTKSFPNLSKSGFQPGAGENLVQSVIDAREIATTLISRVTSLALIYLAARVVAQTIVRSYEEISARQTTYHSNSASQLARILPQNITLDDYEREIADSILLSASISDEWRNLGGMEVMKQQLLDLVDYDEEYWRDKLNSTAKGSLFEEMHSALFFGPPGCGKSTLIRALCKKLDLPVIPLTPSLLLRKYVGETSRLLRALFSLARKVQPVVIYIDEVDALFKHRNEDDNSWDRQLKTEFIQLWDQLLASRSNVLIVAATNRPQDLDPAVQRRFDRSFMLHLPDEESRRDIFRTALVAADARLSPSFDFARCAALTMGYSSSDIANVCRATLTSMRRRRDRRIRRRGLPPSTPVRMLRTKDVEETIRTYLPISWATATYQSMSTSAPGWMPPPSAPLDPSLDATAAEPDDDDADEADDE